MKYLSREYPDKLLLDAAIDRLAYALHALTAEEIVLVETEEQLRGSPHPSAALNSHHMEWQVPNPPSLSVIPAQAGIQAILVISFLF